jgi:hypothetical protein
MQVPRHQVPEATAHSISHHGLTNRPADDKTHLRGLINVTAYSQVPNQQRATEPAALPDRRRELRPAPHPRGRRQHQGSSNQAFRRQ